MTTTTVPQLRPVTVLRPEPRTTDGHRVPPSAVREASRPRAHRRSPQPPLPRAQLRRRLAIAALLLASVGSLLLSVPRVLGFDIAVLWITLAAVGRPFSVPVLLVAYNVGYLANSLPVPGGIGVLDAGLAGALILYGAAPAHAAAAELIYHAIAFWVPGLGGILAYTRLHRRLSIADRG